MEQQDHEIQVLVEASAKGDVASCKLLYELVVDKVYAYVRYRTRTNEQATDVTQDVFIDFFSTLARFTYLSHAQFYAYVFLITRRKLAKHYTSQKMKQGGEVVEFDEESMSPVEDASTASGIEEEVAEALAHLDSQTQEIVTLHHWSRYTFGEIAKMLNMTESAVRVRHHRARPVLAKYLKDREE